MARLEQIPYDDLKSRVQDINASLLRSKASGFSDHNTFELLGRTYSDALARIDSAKNLKVEHAAVGYITEKCEAGLKEPESLIASLKKNIEASWAEQAAAGLATLEKNTYKDEMLSGLIKEIEAIAKARGFKGDFSGGNSGSFIEFLKLKSDVAWTDATAEGKTHEQRVAADREARMFTSDMKLVTLHTNKMGLINKFRAERKLAEEALAVLTPQIKVLSSCVADGRKAEKMVVELAAKGESHTGLDIDYVKKAMKVRKESLKAGNEALQTGTKAMHELAKPRTAIINNPAATIK